MDERSARVANVQPVVVTPLTVVAEFPHQQVTGVAVSRSGRMFANFPYWSDGHTVSVVELSPTGGQQPYPSLEWNSHPEEAANHFVCVQSVVIDSADNLWIVDAGSPKQTGVVPGGAKLVRVDLATDQVAQVIRFDESVAPPKSYLNDVRVDPANQFAFLTDSNLGAIVVVDLRTGQARRVLESDPSVLPEPNLRLAVEGNTLIDPQKQRPLAIASDGIAIDRAGGWLYYKALTGHTLYRVRLDALEAAARDRSVDLRNAVERVGTVPASDGLAFRDGQVYLSAIEQNAVVRYDPARRSTETIAQDAGLKWPDSFAFGPDGSLYVTTSQIHLTPRFNQGASRVTEPFRIYKIAAPTLTSTQAAAE